MGQWVQGEDLTSDLAGEVPSAPWLHSGTCSTLGGHVAVWEWARERK